MFPTQECDSKAIRHVQVYGPKWASSNREKIRSYHYIFVMLYVAQIGWLVSTMGQPYRDFLIKADREGFAVMEGSTQLRAELEHSLGDVNDPNRRTKKIGWMDWMDMDIEELAEEKKRDKQTTVLESLPSRYRVPHKYAPAFVPCLLLGILATLHALLLLLQHWSVTFNIWMNYKELNVQNLPHDYLPDELMQLPEDVDDNDATTTTTTTPITAFAGQIPSYLPTHVCVQPDNKEDRAVLLPVEYFPTLGMTFEYHRRRYLFHTSQSSSQVVSWSKIRCRTDLPLHFFPKWKGFGQVSHVQAATIRYGRNIFEVKQPEFMELYKAQLLNPFTVFQLFCVLLWAIDDYLIYSFFSLFMVLLFEGTVVFSRLKSLQALRGMGNPIRTIWVYRNARWTTVDSTDLLPGDIMSLTRSSDEGGDVVPADVLLLRGTTVVNEASLTGESVPQMKEGLADLTTQDDDECLDIKNRHKMNVAYAGTKMLQCQGAAAAATTDTTTTTTPTVLAEISNPPDGGCLCFVLRTGFSSAQGKLVRMIEGSQEKVKGHEKDTGLLLALLCIFAIASSSYVLWHGLQSDQRSKYELLLHCIMIVTSVIRPELPMQMAMAVNNSLMTLMKMHIFCTEPYRVPTAGKLDACLFDKTGTLTTDELVAVGVLDPKQLKQKSNDAEELITPMIQVSNEAALVIAGCHSLVVFEGETTGDPLESAALKSIRWNVTDKGMIQPMPTTTTTTTTTASTNNNSKTPKKTKTTAETKNTVKQGGKPIALNNGTTKVSSLEILTRHHFSSKLQRMSCVIRDNKGKHYVVAKGSPEAIGRYLKTKPNGYDSQAEHLSKEGYRVIALAYRAMDESSVEQAKESRAVCEADMIFCGFIAFTCKVRKDTASVLFKLKQGGMTIAMVTGDALLTAIHVAKEVRICRPLKEDDAAAAALEDEKNPELKAFLEGKRGVKPTKEKEHVDFHPILYLAQKDNGIVVWQSYENSDDTRPYVAKEVPQLSKDFDLATSGKCLAAAFEYDEHTKQVLEYFKVFARMTPDAKETVIECLHSVGKLCLMCGDGANDVGALKQADVGVALLSGFGNVNVDHADEKSDEEKAAAAAAATTGDGLTAIMSQDHLNQIRALPIGLLKTKIRSLGADPDKYPDLIEKEDLVKLYQIKAREVAVQRHDKKNATQKAKMTRAEKQAEHRAQMLEKQEKMARRVQELEAQGESWASFKAMKEIWAEEMAKAKDKKAEMTKARGIEGSAASLAAQLEEMDTGDMPMVKLGDASIAAPFTSKMPSIKNCVDIVRQGRCTLVSSIQMYQILALQSLISSYSLSVLYLDGVKYGDSQMTALGLLGSVSFMSVSRSKPLDRLSKVRPLTSIFHPALFFSLLGQFTIHLITMIVAVRKAKEHMPEEEVDLDGAFKPGMLNTVVFLVSGVQQVTVFVVNLQGRPFMTGVTENRPLLWSLLSTFILTFMFASETVPGLNRYFQLVPFPDEAMRDFIVTILIVNLVATYGFDLWMKILFCPHILKASFQETTWKEMFGFVRTFAVIAFMMYSFLGSDETWEQIELAMAEMENATAAEAAAEAAEAAGECVGDLCNVIQNATMDEF